MSPQVANWGAAASVGGPPSWSGPTKAFLSDNQYASAVFTGAGNFSITDFSLRLISDTHAYFGSNKADTTTNWPASDAVATYGDVNDLWGLNTSTLTPAIINDVDFGVELTVVLNSPSTQKSAALEVYTGSFSIPAAATILGVVVDVERNRTFNSRSGDVTANVDMIRCTVYYFDPAHDLLKTLTNHVNIFGLGQTMNWGEFDWGYDTEGETNNWGYNSGLVIWDLGKNILGNSTPILSAISSKQITRTLSITLTCLSETTSEQMTEPEGYNIVFIAPDIEAENRNLSSFTSTTNNANIFTMVSMTSNPFTQQTNPVAIFSQVSEMTPSYTLQTRPSGGFTKATALTAGFSRVSNSTAGFLVQSKPSDNFTQVASSPLSYVQSGISATSWSN
jgi:hypothetical protein